MAIIHHEERLRKQKISKEIKRLSEENRRLSQENATLRTLLNISNKNPVFTKVTKKISRRDQYLHPNWQRMRLLIMMRDNFSCKKCGAKNKMLHIHHLKYVKDCYIWEVPPEYLITLCEKCHNKKHYG